MDFDIAFNKASLLCARQEYCRSDIAEKLQKWDTDAAIIKKVLAQLVVEKYIDEERFAGFYVRDKFRFNRWGKQKITWQLRQKRIPDEHIQSAIESITDEDYAKTLFQLLKEKARSIKDKDTRKKLAALVRFAVSRGFEMSEVMPLAVKLCGDVEDELTS
ncbi:MAG: RecX family transcriptional regulator [Cytophagaceae bacterium]|jgi:regulatory protein|nr:RecX family transcriptional regulator [Cytophagaceae bacterium]